MNCLVVSLKRWPWITILSHLESLPTRRLKWVSGIFASETWCEVEDENVLLTLVATEEATVKHRGALSIC